MEYNYRICVLFYFIFLKMHSAQNHWIRENTVQTSGATILGSHVNSFMLTTFKHLAD